MTEGCGGVSPPRSAASVGAAPPPALITCCYWSVKFEYAFSLLKVWLVLARGQQQRSVCLFFFLLVVAALCLCSSSRYAGFEILELRLNKRGNSSYREHVHICSAFWFCF